MEATIVDLRYKMKDVLRALDRNEEVKILYHGKEKAVIVPIQRAKKSKVKVKDLPFFGMTKSEKASVEDIMRQLRGERYTDI